MLKSKTFISITFIFFIMISASFLSAQDTSTESKNPESAKTEDTADNAITLGNIVVTATRTEIDRRETGTSLTVITEDDIKKSGKTNLADALNNVPGVTINRNSVFGGQASVYIRGTDTGNILVMIDGIEVNDPSSPYREFDFSNLMLENIERIEILRGPQSTLYGSDASGGVINIITKKGKGDPKISLLFEGGSFMTFREGIAVSGSSEKIDFSFSASNLKTEGISKAAKPDGADYTPEKDGYKNITVASRVGVDILDKSRIDFSFRYIDTASELDDGALAEDPNFKYFTKIICTGAQFKQPLTGWWQHVVSLSYMDQLRTARDSADETDPTSMNEWYEGTSKKAGWQHNFNIYDKDTVTAGVEIEEETGSYLFYDDFGYGPSAGNLDEKKAQTLSYYGQNHLRLMDMIFITLGGRIDDHREFGTHFSYKASGAFIIQRIETRLKGNYGTGFKAPSIYQLYDPIYGNKDLDPEESRCFDFGFDQKIFNDRISLGATYFNNYYRNMLTFGLVTSKFENIGEATMKGIEGEITVQPLDNLKISYVHTYQVTEDKETKEELVRRPHNQSSLVINVFPLEKLNLNLIMLYVGKRADNYYNSITYATDEKTLGSYFKVDLAASYDLLDNLQIFGRVENMADKKYQESYGYAMPGRSFYGGARAVF